MGRFIQGLFIRYVFSGPHALAVIVYLDTMYYNLHPSDTFSKAVYYFAQAGSNFEPVYIFKVIYGLIRVRILLSKVIYGLQRAHILLSKEIYGLKSGPRLEVIPYSLHYNPLPNRGRSLIEAFYCINTLIK